MEWYTNDCLEDKIIRLYLSRDPANIELAAQLEATQPVDISLFWEEVLRLVCAIHFGDGRTARQQTTQWNDLHRKNKTKLLQGLYANSDGITRFQARYWGWTQLPSQPVWQYYCNEKITRICLTANQLTAFPPQLRSLRHLRYIDLSHNRIRQIPDWIVELEALETLRISYNQLTRLPDALFRLPRLQTLHLDANPLSLPPDQPWANWQSTLRELSLSEIPQPPPVLPESLQACRQLNYLNINGLSLGELPTWIASFPLCVLAVRRNNLASLPPLPQIYNHLQRLDLAENQLTHWDAPLQGEPLTLQQLRQLDMSNNAWRVFPHWLLCAPFLRYWSAAHNDLSLCLSQIPPPQIQYLQYCNLSHCNLSALPPFLFQIRSVWDLHLQHNKLSSLPNDYPDTWRADLHLHGNLGLDPTAFSLKKPPNVRFLFEKYHG